MIRPPITTVPIGARHAPSPLNEMAVGTIPAVIATVVMTIGWARLCPASVMAVSLSVPVFISSIAKSISRMEFFDTMPSSIRMPIITGIEIG